VVRRQDTRLSSWTMFTIGCVAGYGISWWLVSRRCSYQWVAFVVDYKGRMRDTTRSDFAGFIVRWKHRIRMIARCGVGVVGAQPPKLQGQISLQGPARRRHDLALPKEANIVSITTSMDPVIMMLSFNSNPQSCRMILSQTARGSRTFSHL
jgi:hypothetical protein